MAVSDSQLQRVAKKKGSPFRFETKDGKIAQMVAVEGNGNPLYLVTHNANVAITSGVDKLHPGGTSHYDLTGKNVKILEWDGAHVLANHYELEGRVILAGDTLSPMDLSNHSTHVAGTMISKGIYKPAAGMAPEATVKSWNFDNNYLEIYNAMKTQDGILSNHSYGFDAGWVYNSSKYVWTGDDNVSTTEDYKFGYYSEFDAVTDEILKGAPWHTMICSSGNQNGEGTAGQPQQIDGGEQGYGSIGFGSVSKNAIYVGAVEPVFDYTGPESVKLCSFSSTGPADDGRILPTVVNDGYQVISTTAKDKGSYVGYSGTSMASPATTGAVALIQGFAKEKTGKYLSSSTVKALLANTAKEAGNPGPDYKYGFGLVDALAAVQTVDYNGRETRCREGVLTNGEIVTLKLKTQAGKPVRATLAWVDRPGEPLAWISDDTPKTPEFLNNRKPMLVDDLDLRIEQNGVVYTPYKLDPENPAANATTGDNVVDNIEQVYIPNPQTGEITLTISHKGTLDDQGVDYGLVVNGLEVANDLEVSNLVSTVEADQYSANTPIKATVKNIGTASTPAFKVRFTVKNSVGEVLQEVDKDMLALTAGSSADVTAELSLTDVFKEYTVTAKAVYDADGAVNNNIAQGQFTPVVADLTTAGSRMLENFNIDDLAKHSWKIVNVIAKKSKPWAFLSKVVSHDNSQYVCNGNTDKKTEDWMLTNPVVLKAGDKYRVSYYTYKLSRDTIDQEVLDVFVGDTNEVAAMQTLVGSFTHDQSEPNENWKKVSFEFEAQKDGRQFFGIKHHSGDKVSWGVALEDFKVENVSEGGKPSVDFNFISADTRTWNTIYTDVSMVNETYSSAATSYKWSFYPDAVEYINGTTDSTEAPQLRFKAEGRFSVKLVATNEYGSDEMIKNDYIEVRQPNLTIGFNEDRSKIYVGENVQFKNMSQGFPTITKHEWSFVPNEQGALTFLEGTSPNTEHLNVRFNKAGIYTVKLTETNSQGERTVVREDYVNVRSNDNPPLDLTGNVESPTSVALSWQRPDSLYYDSYLNTTFDLVVPWPAKPWYTIDANNDRVTWMPLQAIDGNWVASAFSYWNDKARQEDDYLVSPVVKNLPAGYTELTFNSPATTKNPDYAEPLRLYYVPVDSDAQIDAEYIKTYGKVLFDSIPYNVTDNLRGFQKFELAEYMADGKPFRLAFYAYSYDKNTTTLDNVRIAPVGAITAQTPIKSSVDSWGEEDLNDDRDKFLLAATKPASGALSFSENATNKPTWAKLSVGPNNKITHYNILRDGSIISAVDGNTTVFVDNTVPSAGTYTYNVVAMYDGLNQSQLSNEASVSTVSTGIDDVNVNSDAKPTVFPNPVVDVVKVKFAQAISGVTDVELYSTDGKIVFKESANASDLTVSGINISNLSSGVYIMKIKNNGKSYVVNIIKK